MSKVWHSLRLFWKYIEYFWYRCYFGFDGYTIRCPKCGKFIGETTSHYFIAFECAHCHFTFEVAIRPTVDLTYRASQRRRN